MAPPLPPDPRLISPAAERNLAPILEALQALAPTSGNALEIASGPGQHIIAFARAFPCLTWRPSDPDPAARASTAAYAADHALPNLLPPIALDASAPHWGVAESDGPFDLILAINLAHIAPFAATEGLFAGAARLLTAEGKLLLYGPFLSGDGTDAPSNLAFDAALRAQNPAWGVRTLAEILGAADAAGLALIAERPMPANNRMLALQRR